MHLHYDPADFIELANRVQQTDGFDEALDKASTGGPTGGSSRSAIGQRLFDASGNELGILVEVPEGSGRLFLQSTQRQEPRDLAAGGAPPPLVRFQAGTYLLGNNVALNIDGSGNFIEPRDLPFGSTGGAGGRSIAQEIELLEAQAAIARREGDHAREADFRNQIEVLKLNQGFTAGENVLSRENQVRLQRLDSLSRLQQQILADKARGQNLLVEMIGNDPIRAGALAQGGVPRRGTPADIFRGELTTQVNQPLVQPASMGISDINAAITETQGNLGLPSPGSLGFNDIPSAAHGATIDMKKKDGKFRILVGDAGPELLEGDRNQIQITPIASAAHGAKVSFSEDPFITFDVPGFSSGPTPRTATSPQRIPLSPFTEPRVTLPTITPGGIRPSPTQASASVPGDVLPVPPPAVAPPISTIQDNEFVRPGGQLTQGFESIFDFLGFDRVPTFTEGQFGGMQLPAGRQAETFAALGIDPSLFRAIDESGQGNAFFRTPSGELQQFSPGGLFQQSLAFGPGAGFAPQDFVTVNADQFGDTSGATPFEAQGLASSSNPFPNLRSPLAVGSEVTGGAGFLLPDPRTLASLWPRLPESVKQNLLSAYGLTDTQRNDVLQRLNFFTARGGFQGVAGFG